MWKELGGSITIQCRTAAKEQNIMTLKRGLHKDPIFATNNDWTSVIRASKVENRTLVNGTFPNLNITITNLVMEDTGPYWCFYSMLSKTIETKEGKGAVLLVVKGEPILSKHPVNSSMIIRGLCCFNVRDECFVC